MNWKEGLARSGVPAALGAALLFGAGTPLAKSLLDAVSPWLLAGLLYLGSGVGLTLYRHLVHAPTVRLPRNEVSWFAGAILAGGIVGPVLLMIGLTGMPASGAPLLLNAEGVFTALLAWLSRVIEDSITTYRYHSSIRCDPRSLMNLTGSIDITKPPRLLKTSSGRYGIGV